MNCIQLQTHSDVIPLAVGRVLRFFPLFFSLVVRGSLGERSSGCSVLVFFSSLVRGSLGNQVVDRDSASCFGGSRSFDSDRFERRSRNLFWEEERMRR